MTRGRREREEKREDRMVTRGRGELYANRQFNPLSLCSIVGHTHGSDKRETRKRGEERKREEKRGDRMVTRGRGELYTIRQEPFNPQSPCSIVGHTHRSDKRETRKRGEERRQDGDERERRALCK